MKLRNWILGFSYVYSIHNSCDLRELKLIMYKSSHLEVSWKKGVLRNFTKFTRKHLCRSIFSNKVAILHPVLKRYPGTGVLKNTFSIEHLRATASKYDVTFRELFRLIELFTPKSIDPPKLRNFRESHTAPFNYHPLTFWNFLVKLSSAKWNSRVRTKLKNYSKHKQS